MLFFKFAIFFSRISGEYLEKYHINLGMLKATPSTRVWMLTILLSITSLCSEQPRCADEHTALTDVSTLNFNGGVVLAYMSSPCHIEVILTEKEDVVAKPSDDIPRAKKEMLQLERIAWVVGARLASSCSVVPSGTHEVVQVQGKLGRSSKQQCRECDLAAAFYEEGKRSGLRKLMKIVTKQREASEATSRCAAFAAALALKLVCFFSVKCIIKQTMDAVAIHCKGSDSAIVKDCYRRRF
ncbi:hypothetical protein ANCCAN_28110 [Ancylostoma caninum]|uniref:Uncharacterized protein n=1 Tax=Ancylostoma caninum TaxID=29170 RepID=A0A368F249_ANCCA|nr:hypothetical protein ANCCAN_28110 [Ancylostoma caninum]